MLLKLLRSKILLATSLTASIIFGAVIVYILIMSKDKVANNTILPDSQEFSPNHETSNLTSGKNDLSTVLSKKRILILNSYHETYHWTDKIMSGIKSALESQGNIELFITYFDTKRCSDSAHFEILRELLRNKYKKIRFDAILSSDDHALNFLLSNRDSLFPDVPVVFCGINDYTPERILGHNNFTGIYESYDIKGTLELILNLHPQTKKIAVISDATYSGYDFIARMKRTEQLFKDKLTFVYYTGLSLKDVEAKLSSISEETVVIWSMYLREAGDLPISCEQSVGTVSNATTQPVYCIWDVVGQGVVGGKITDPGYQGNRAAEIVLEILNGKSVADIPVEGSPMVYKFDYNSMLRFNIKESDLPEGSIIINEPYSFYKEYKTLVWIVAAAFALLSIIVLMMTYLFRRSRRAEKEIKQQHIELSDKEEKFRKLFEEASDAILLLYDNGCIFDCNQSACHYFQLTKEELLGKTVIDLSPPYQEDKKSSREKALELLDKTLKNQLQRFEWVNLNGEGKAFTVSASLNKIELSGITYVQAILRDITMRIQKDKELEMHRNHLEKLVSEKTKDLEVAYRELQKANEELHNKNNIIHDQNLELKTTLQHLQETQVQLLQSEKMASLGILTAGVAHEINNPLNYIMGAYAGLLKYYNDNTFLENYKQVGTLINALKIGVDRSSAIVKGLNQFSRKSDSHDEDCDLHAIIANSLTMLHNQIKHKITVEKEFSASDIIIKGNVGNLHQAFLNILGNAVQSIESEGVIKIKTESENSKTIITIADTGAGIPATDLKKITDPFFTTKDPGKGTGLGLSITYNIIKEHKGKLEFESEVGKGTTVKIIIPKNNLLGAKR